MDFEVLALQGDFKKYI